MRRRGLSFIAVLLALLAGFGGVAWLTHHPEAPVLDRLQRWPVVGPLAEAFRHRYLPPRPRQEPAAEPVQSASVREAERRPPEPVSSLEPAAETVWVAPGTELRVWPSHQSEARGRIASAACLPRLERRGDWFRVRWGGTEGWVWREGYRDDQWPPLGSEPDPVVPVSAAPPDPERLAAARRLLTAPEQVRPLGGYTLYTDVDDEELIRGLEIMVSELEVLYTARYGLAPIGEPAEAIILFASHRAYREYEKGDREPDQVLAVGHATRGIVASYRQYRSAAEVAGTLAHELVHLLNRRAIGPALPPWLDEGMADDVAESNLIDWRLQAGTLGGRRVVEKRRMELTGALAGLEHLHQDLLADRLFPLSDLVTLDRSEFASRCCAARNYAQAAELVRYLVGPRSGKLEERFLGFLAAVAGGGRADPQSLIEALGTSWDDLEAGFRAWIVHQADDLLRSPITTVRKQPSS